MKFFDDIKVHDFIGGSLYPSKEELHDLLKWQHGVMFSNKGGTTIFQLASQQEFKPLVKL